MGAHPPQSAGHSQPQLVSTLHTWRPEQFWQAAGAHSQAQAAELQIAPSGQPPQSAGHAQAQSLAGSQRPAPPQLASQSGAQAQSQVEVLHTWLPEQRPPQSLGHWQLHAAVLHTRFGVLAQAPPQLPSHSQAQVAGLQTVPGPQPPQSAGHSHAQVAWLQTWFGPQLPLQSGVQVQAQLASQTWFAVQLALHWPWSQVHTPSCPSQIWFGPQGRPQGASGGSQTR